MKMKGMANTKRAAIVYITVGIHAEDIRPLFLRALYLAQIFKKFIVLVGVASGSKSLRRSYEEHKRL